MARAQMMPASIVTGTDVTNSAGEDLGHIEDIMLDLEHGRIAYAVLSFGGFMGMGDKLFAIPWEALQQSSTEDAFILEVPEDVLKDAEGFDKDNWPDMADRGWATEIYNYYGYDPYWVGDMPAERPASSRTMASRPTSTERAMMDEQDRTTRRRNII